MELELIPEQERFAGTAPRFLEGEATWSVWHLAFRAVQVALVLRGCLMLCLGALALPRCDCPLTSILFGGGNA